MSIALYILRIIIVVMRISLGTFDVIGLGAVLLLVALIIKDILLYGVEIKATKVTSYDLHKASTHTKQDRYLLSNKIYIFPNI